MKRLQQIHTLRIHTQSTPLNSTYRHGHNGHLSEGRHRRHRQAPADFRRPAIRWRHSAVGQANGLAPDIPLGRQGAAAGRATQAPRGTARPPPPPPRPTKLLRGVGRQAGSTAKPRPRPRSGHAIIMAPAHAPATPSSCPPPTPSSWPPPTLRPRHHRGVRVETMACREIRNGSPVSSKLV